MRAYSEIVMGAIDSVMRDCAKGVYSDHVAIIKIQKLVEKYTDYHDVMRKVQNLIVDIQIEKSKLKELEENFDSVCHERDAAVSELESRLDEIL